MSVRFPYVTLALGGVLIPAGLFVALRPLFTHNATITGQRSLDFVFAFYFFVSGSLRIRRALRRARA